MKKPPRIFKPGTPREIAEPARGYTANGESEFTRAASHHRVSQMALGSATPARLGKGRKLSKPELIREYAGRIRWLEAELRTDLTPKKREQYTKSLALKRRLLADLRRETNEAMGVSC
jgi:hypothetical protein